MPHQKTPETETEPHTEPTVLDRLKDVKESAKAHIADAAGSVHDALTPDPPEPSAAEKAKEAADIAKDKVKERAKSASDAAASALSGAAETVKEKVGSKDESKEGGKEEGKKAHD